MVAICGVLPLWPQPVEQNFGTSAAWLDSNAPLELDASIHYMRVRGHPVSEILHAAYERVRIRVFEQAIVPEKFFPRRARFEPAIEARAIIKRVVIKTAGSTSDCISKKQASESYKLTVKVEDGAVIQAVSYHGWLHGLTTLAQLFFAHSELPGKAYTYYVPVTVRDYPAFEHRGLSLDIARNRISPKMVVRILDAMSQSRMNRLHLHAWDSQSWPLEIPALPKLAEKGAYHKSQIWSVNDLAMVQREGFFRGIDVYVEGDMPGHTASVHHGYPDLVVGYDLRPFKNWSEEPPTGQLKLNSPDVREFLDRLLDDLLPRLRQYSDFFHLGCDEVNKRIYELDETVCSSDAQVLKPFLEDLLQSVVGQCRKHELQTIAWEEPVLNWDVDIGKDTIVQAWKSEDSVAAIVAKGHRAIASSHKHWFLDAGFGSWVTPSLDPDNPTMLPPYKDWIGMYNNWKWMLTYDPLKGIPDEHKSLVLGGETCLWGELADESNIDVMLWPRVCAAAEVLWRGRGEIGEITIRRLALMRDRLVAQGFACQMVQMEWCLRNQDRHTL